MARMAGGTCGGGNAIESFENLCADAAGERDVERVRQPVVRMPVEDDPVAEGLSQPLPEVVPEGAYVLDWREISSQLTGLPEPDGQQRTFRARAAAAFMPPTVDERLERGATANVKSANALRRMDLVTSDGEQVDAKLVHVRGNLSHRLRRVGVEVNSPQASDATHLGDWLDCPHLVVGMHDADENGPRRDRPHDIARVDMSKAIDRDDSHLEAQLLQEPAWPKDCRMLDRASDDVVTFTFQSPSHPLEGEVVGLAAATGEDDFMVLGAEQRRYLAARLFERGLGAFGRPMTARRIAEM